MDIKYNLPSIKQLRNYPEICLTSPSTGHTKKHDSSYFLVFPNISLKKCPTKLKNLHEARQKGKVSLGFYVGRN